jgi:hypothetical protein
MNQGGLGTAYATRPGTRAGGFSVLSWISVGVVVMLWVAFAVAAAAAPSALTQVWVFVDGLPLVARMVVWVVGLPWLVGIAVWQGSGPDLVRLGLLAGLALVSVWTFYPTSSR